MMQTTGDHPASPTQRLDDLAQIIAAYNDVTEKLQASHESLQAEVVRLQQELRSKNAQLQRSRRLAALGEMAAGIAHEIRNPLSAIQLYAEMLADDLTQLRRDDGEVVVDVVASAETSAKIVSAVQGLDAIVNDVLSFARDVTPKPQTVAVATLFARAVDANAAALEAAGVHVDQPDADTQEFSAGLPLMIHADPRLIQQALVNLIRNAVEAMQSSDESAGLVDDGSRCRVLTLTARADDVSVVLSVADNGPGIAEETIDRIFNPFFTTRGAGTGLGLAIVHRIVDAHGGAIAVRNDGGAVFELTLPAANAPVEAPHDAVLTGQM